MAGVGLLGVDRLPPGPRRDLVLAVRVYYDAASRPAVRRISKYLKDNLPSDAVSHQTVTTTLSGQALPRWNTLEAIMRALVALETLGIKEDIKVVLGEIRDAWLKANDDVTAGVAQSGHPGDANRELSEIPTEINRLAAEQTQDTPSGALEIGLLSHAPGEPTSSSSVTLPPLGEGIADATVTRWLKQVGDHVAIRERFIELDTAMGEIFLRSAIAGQLREIKIAEGRTVEVGTELAIVDTATSPLDTPHAEPAAATREIGLATDQSPRSERHSRPRPTAATDIPPAWPKIRIRLYDDHNAEVKIAGRTHQVNHHDPRQAAIELVRKQAALLGRPVLTEAIDSDGTTWPLIIHPDGRVDPIQEASTSRLPRWLRKRR